MRIKGSPSAPGSIIAVGTLSTGVWSILFSTDRQAVRLNNNEFRLFGRDGGALSSGWQLLGGPLSMDSAGESIAVWAAEEEADDAWDPLSLTTPLGLKAWAQFSSK